MVDENNARGNRGGNRDENRGNRRPREDRTPSADESRLIDESNFGGLVSEAIETLGTDLSGSAAGRFMDLLTVKLWEMGFRSTATISGVVVGLKSAIRVMRWTPNVQSFLEGVVEGLNRELWGRYRDLVRAQEEGRIDAELTRLRGGAPKAVPGATVPGTTPTGTPVVVVAAPKATYTTFHQMLTRHPRRADLMKVMAQLREAQPLVYQVILVIEARPGFLEEFAEYALELNDDFREEALDRFLKKTIDLAEKEHEAKVKSSLSGAYESFKKGFKATLQRVDEIADLIGLPKAPAPVQGRPTMPAIPPPAGGDTTPPPPVPNTAHAAPNGEPEGTEWARLKQMLRDKR